METEETRLVDIYKTMVRIRGFEERVFKEFTRGKIPGFVHSYAGEEAIAVGACACLRTDDYITSTHRGHGHLIAKGGKPALMMAELFGKRTGYNKGKGGSMHIADVDLGMLGANGIVGAGIPIAGGAALRCKLKKTDQVAICFFGDGASNTGRFHEGVNLAACLGLPVVYVIENNMYAISISFSYATKVESLADRAAAYGIPGVSVDGNDVTAVYEAVGAAVDRARSGGGPSVVECKTFRIRGHFVGDNQAYLDKKEIEKWRERDPIEMLKRRLIKDGLFGEKDAVRIQEEAEAEMEEAVKFAEESPMPAVEETLEDVYTVQKRESSDDSESKASGGASKTLTYLQAINEAASEEMERDPELFLIGEDLRALGAPRGEYRGLFDRYGPDRVIDTPISETAILGGAIGAAAAGMRPIASLMYASFLGVCGDEIINQLTHMRYMFGGKIKMPVTITCYCGAGFSGGAQHCKNLYGILAGIPGLKIVVPSTPYDAKGLLKSAIREDNPTIVLYHQLLLRRVVTSEVPEADYVIPLGKADIKREGRDVTVVAIGLMVHRAIAAAGKLHDKGIDIEVIDPRTLVPLDEETIASSVKKTGRLVIMDDEPRTGSIASEIAATIGEKVFEHLKSPIMRVCGPDTPVPFSPVLEDYWIPDEDNLIAMIQSLI